MGCIASRNVLSGAQFIRASALLEPEAEPFCTSYQDVPERWKVESSDVEVLLFVSHRWLSRALPDPLGTQVRLVRGLLEDIFKQRTTDFVWCDAQRHARKSVTEYAAEMRDTGKGFEQFLQGIGLWYDYMCLPQCQINDRIGSFAAKLKRLRSLVQDQEIGMVRHSSHSYRDEEMVDLLSIPGLHDVRVPNRMVWTGYSANVEEGIHDLDCWPMQELSSDDEHQQARGLHQLDDIIACSSVCLLMRDSGCKEEVLKPDEPFEQRAWCAMEAGVAKSYSIGVYEPDYAPSVSGGVDDLRTRLASEQLRVTCATDRTRILDIAKKAEGRNRAFTFALIAGIFMVVSLALMRATIPNVDNAVSNETFAATARNDSSTQAPALGVEWSHVPGFLAMAIYLLFLIDLYFWLVPLVIDYCQKHGRLRGCCRQRTSFRPFHFYAVSWPLSSFLGRHLTGHSGGIFVTAACSTAIGIMAVLSDFSTVFHVVGVLIIAWGAIMGLVLVVLKIQQYVLEKKISQLQETYSRKREFDGEDELLLPEFADEEHFPGPGHSLLDGSQQP